MAKPYVHYFFIHKQTETSLYILFISGQERRTCPPIGQVGAVAGTGHEEEGGILNRRSRCLVKQNIPRQREDSARSGSCCRRVRADRSSSTDRRKNGILQHLDRKNDCTHGNSFLLPSHWKKLERSSKTSGCKKPFGGQFEYRGKRAKDILVERMGLWFLSPFPHEQGKKIQ